MVSHTDAVILCGGQGRRLKSVVADTQKVMAEINGRPFLDILLDHIQKQGVGRVILCTGYQGEALERYYRQENRGLTIEFSREQNPLGTGGALKNARYFINSDPFFVLNGDSFCAIDLNAFLDFHKSKLARGTIAVSRAAQTGDYGSITLDESDGITGFREKQTADVLRYVNAGIYCLNEDVFSLMPDEQTFSLEYDFFPALTGKGFYGFCVDAPFYDIGTPQRYAEAQKKLKDKI